MVLAGLVGCYGFKVASLKSEKELIEFARKIFGIPQSIDTTQRAAEYIYGLGRSARKSAVMMAARKFSKDCQPRQDYNPVWDKDPNATPVHKHDIGEFYKSWEWKKLRYEILKERGRRCECCGATPDNGAVIVVDHIQPVRKHWNLRLEKSNLQILCNDCNMGKGWHDTTRWADQNVGSESLARLEEIRRQLTIK